MQKIPFVLNRLLNRLLNADRQQLVFKSRSKAMD